METLAFLHDIKELLILDRGKNAPKAMHRHHQGTANIKREISHIST